MSTSNSNFFLGSVLAPGRQSGLGKRATTTTWQRLADAQRSIAPSELGGIAIE